MAKESYHQQPMIQVSRSDMIRKIERPIISHLSDRCGVSRPGRGPVLSLRAESPLADHDRRPPRAGRPRDHPRSARPQTKQVRAAVGRARHAVAASRHRTNGRPSGRPTNQVGPRADAPVRRATLHRSPRPQHARTARPQPPPPEIERYAITSPHQGSCEPTGQSLWPRPGNHQHRLGSEIVSKSRSL